MAILTDNIKTVFPLDNISLHALDVNSDAVVAATLQYAMNTEEINGLKGKGNFKPDMEFHGPNPSR